MQTEDFLRKLGRTSLGTRLRRLTERLNTAVGQLYRDRLGFEQRWFALTLLLGEKGEMRIGDAAAALGLSHVSVVQAAREMQRAGLLEKRLDAADRRVTLLALTSEGTWMLARVKAISRLVDKVTDEMLAETAPDFIRSLDRLDDALQAEDLPARLQRMEAAGNKDVIP